MQLFLFQKPARPVTKVFIHCSASDNPDHDNVATMDAWHKERGWAGVGYHLFGRKDGTGEIGRSIEKTPAAQAGHNRGSIAICLHGLEEGKFTQAQEEWLIEICGQINRAYRGKVTFHGHREVAAKACPVIDYQTILGLDAEGYMGNVPSPGVAKLADYGDLSVLETAEALPSVTLRMGAKGGEVRDLQSSLKDLGYRVGKIDGHFGKLTRDAVLAFQADNHLVEDGVAGPATFEALGDAVAREMAEERQAETVTGLVKSGSRIARGSVVQGAAGTVLVGAGAYPLLDDAIGLLNTASELADAASGGDPASPLVMLVGGVVVILTAIRSALARRDDHRSGKTL